MISSIIFRNEKLNSKGEQVNSYSKTLCSQNSIGYIDNNLITGKHLRKRNSYELSGHSLTRE